MKQMKVGILGFGTVGSGVYRILTENKGDIMHRDHLELLPARILVKDFEHEPNIGMAPKELFTTSIDEIVSDPEIGIVVECMGGVEPAKSFILAALNAGKTVVTSNKEVFSKHWQELEEAAKAHNAGLYHEATVGGGIPIIRTITDSMQANNITEIMGIINGTTNFILTKMAEDNLSFDEALKEAQQLGYAEANPAADVEGWDATYKLSILASMAFHTHVPIDSIYREGITRITLEDIQMAKRLGYEIKLLAIGKKDEDRNVEVRVHPTMIPKNHPLASVRGSFNAVFLKGHAVGDVMLYGRGAGQMPTASAVMSDVIYACKAGEHRYMTFQNIRGVAEGTTIVKGWPCAFCIRLLVKDQPGVLAALGNVFAKHDISLKSLIQHDETRVSSDEVAITFVTHEANELNVKEALEEIDDLSVVEKVLGLIRVED